MTHKVKINNRIKEKQRSKVDKKKRCRKKWCRLNMELLASGWASLKIQKHIQRKNYPAFF